MSTDAIAFAIGMAVFFILSIGLAAKLSFSEEARENAEQQLADRRLAESGVLNWISLHLNSRHPEVDAVCKAAEDALQNNKMPDVDALGARLDQLRQIRLADFAQATNEVRTVEGRK